MSVPRHGLMVERCIDPPAMPFLVDLGPADTTEGQVRFEALHAAGIGVRNFSIEGERRLLMRLPPSKAREIIAAFPIEDGATYWQTTHHWHGLAEGER